MNMRVNKALGGNVRVQLFAMAVLMSAMQAFGQAAPAPAAMKNLATAADVQALIAKARSELKPGEPFKSETIVKLAPYTVALEYRASRVPPSIHETEAELFYVIEGSGTLTVGGKLTDEHRTNPTNLGGSSIQGGTDYSLTKGDFYFVPEGTPHLWTPVGGPLVTMSMHLARPVTAAH
jgi:mannose-6-phosphate isomerase-like protein (cupin superfamily)